MPEAPRNLDRLRQYYRGVTDAEFTKQYELGPVGVSSPQVWQVIEAEYRTRGETIPSAREEMARQATIQNAVTRVAAGTWLRISAAILDVIAVTFLAVFLAPLEINTAVARLVTLVLYYLVCELLWQRTPGKALFRFKVVSAEGERPTLSALLIRSLTRPFVGGLVWYFTFGTIWIDDIASRTRVISERGAATLSRAV
jgi:hypothetical protein